MVKRISDSTGEDSFAESPSKKHKKHKKHKHRRHEKELQYTHTTEGDSGDDEIKQNIQVEKHTEKPGIKLKIKIGGETLQSSGEGSGATSDKKRKKDKHSALTTAWKAKEDVFRTKKSDEDTSDEEKEWLNALEKGTLDDKGMIKKNKDEKLMTARQRALLHGKQEEPLMQLPTGYKSKDDLSEEQIKKKQQRAKQRRELAVKKHEKDKKQTLERLLRKQEAKTKNGKGRMSRRSRPPGFRYINSQSGISICVPEGKTFPFPAQKQTQIPKAKLCGVKGCKNMKKYNCSKTSVPLCSLQCYKLNLTLH